MRGSSFLGGVGNWLACHLVILTLLGFVLAGVALFLPAEVRQSQGAGETDIAPHVVLRGPDRPSVVATEPASRAAGDKGEPAARQPKLIGGNLPNRHGAGSLEEAAGRHPDSGFRPMGEQTPDAPSMPDRAQWVQAARRAFWNGEFELAEATYMDLLTYFPGDADAFGELGNLYHAMGRRQAAGDAFYEAGVRLKLSGQSEKLHAVISYLEEQSDDRAAQLRE